jgi:hypothetical protein
MQGMPAAAWNDNPAGTAGTCVRCLPGIYGRPRDALSPLPMAAAMAEGREAASLTVPARVFALRRRAWPLGVSSRVGPSGCRFFAVGSRKPSMRRPQALGSGASGPRGPRTVRKSWALTEAREVLSVVVQGGRPQRSEVPRIRVWMNPF